MNSIIEFAEKYWLVSVLCSGVCLLFTLAGGVVLTKGLQALKDDDNTDVD